MWGKKECVSVVVAVERRGVVEWGGLQIRQNEYGQNMDREGKGLHEGNKCRERKNVVAVDVPIVAFMLLLC